MSKFRPSFVAGLVMVALFLGAMPAAVAAADLTRDEARAYLLDKINTARANKGLQRVAVDPRVQDIAQVRSDDMATNHYFGHLSNDKLAAMYNNRGISWTKIGEILAANDWPTLDASADVAFTGWKNSSMHWAIITDGAYNFAGIGIAKDTSSGNWIWTVEFAREPTSSTLTPPSVSFTSQQVLPYNASYRKVRVTWAGTAGTYALKNYALQYRINNGSWRSLFSGTTRTGKTMLVARNKSVQFRVRARDTQGNLSTWTLGWVLST